MTDGYWDGQRAAAGATPKARPLPKKAPMRLAWCTPDCEARSGHIEDPKTGLPIGRCPCRVPPTKDT